MNRYTRLIMLFDNLLEDALYIWGVTIAGERLQS